MITRSKHDSKNSWEYYRHVLTIIKTINLPEQGKGGVQYIVQQRSLKAKHYADKWDMTEGGVMAGEPPKQAACREVKEELGITIKNKI